MPRTLVVCLLMAFAGLTTAGAGEFYVGLDAGRSESEVDMTDFTFGPGTVRAQGKATGFRLRAGFQGRGYKASG